MAPASGRYSGSPARGLSQTTRWARRRTRVIAAASSAGSSLSQPSEPMTTTAPRSADPCGDASTVRRLAAMWVPP